MCTRADKNEKETITAVTSGGREGGREERGKRERKSKKEKRACGDEGEIRREESERVEKASQMLASAWRWNVFKTKEGLI